MSSLFVSIPCRETQIRQLVALLDVHAHINFLILLLILRSRVFQVRPQLSSMVMRLRGKPAHLKSYCLALAFYPLLYVRKNASPLAIYLSGRFQLR